MPQPLKGVFHNNSFALYTFKIISYMKFEILEHPLYYMDLMPSKFYFFGASDETCRVQFFSDRVEKVVKELHEA
jgi:hypothetical protein